jgi:uncharacterized membrane protein
MLEGFLKGKWLGHPLHPIIVHVPVATWLGALIFDLLSRFAFDGNAVVRLSFYSIALGLLSTLLAVPTGIADWSEIKKEKPAWKIGLSHMALNLVASAVFAVNLGLRVKTFQTADRVATVPLFASIAGVVFLVAGAYLGGRMVYDRGIGVARTSKKKWRKIAEAARANVPPEKEK